VGDGSRALAEILHREVARLPKPLRLPVILCHFEGLTPIITAGGEDGHAGVAPIQGVINEAAFRSAWWSRHIPRLTKQARDVKNGS